MAAWINEISNPSHPEYLTYGELLFTNRADAGAYGCARCHTAGWSYNGASDIDVSGDPLNLDADGNPGYVQGGGWFGPNLTNASTHSQFPQADQMIDFIRTGSADGIRYGTAGQGSGQMPGFAIRQDGDLVADAQVENVREFSVDVGGEPVIEWPALLTEDQLAAIVAYERSL